jgi:hypothetical protein
MHLPSAVELIGAWERGAAQHWVDRALTMLSTAHPEITFAELAALTIGQRDLRLLAMHERLFGPSLNCFAPCPQCETRLEFKLNTQDIVAQAGVKAEPAAHEIVLDDVRLEFRAPNSEDLAAAATATDVATARKLIIERTVLEAIRDGVPLRTDGLPESAIEAVADTLANLETHADISFSVTCIGCAHSWQLTLDIVSFLWSEISALAKRHLREVHTLAWAYGWSEADILAMSPARRQFYLESVG